MERNLNLDERERRYAHILQVQSGRAVRPYRADGYVNMLTKYGTAKDFSENYQYQAEPTIPDSDLTTFYESNGLFAKIIDAPAEEAVKHGFELDGIDDENLEAFFSEALDELDWEETAMTAIKWARLFGGSIAVLLVNDGRGLEEPIDWQNIESIDDIRVYDRSLVIPDYSSMFSYDPRDPFRTRGSRLGYPERYKVCSKYGTFTVHDSRVLTFKNGILPENTSNSVYQMWGTPEYLRLRKAIKDSEIAHGTATKMLDRSVQAIYKMKDLSAELATEDGEDRILKRLETIDMARGLMNSITLDSEGEEYDFRTFQFSGVSDVIDSTCNYLSAVSNIPQTVLFGRAPAGMNATGQSDMENYYNYVERIQKRMLRGNLRYLLAIIAQAGVATGEIQEVPKIKVEFKPLWSLSELEEANLEATKVGTQATKSDIMANYIGLGVIDVMEVRRKLASQDELDIDTLLDGLSEEEIETKPTPPGGEGGEQPTSGEAEGDVIPQGEGEVPVEENPNAPEAAPEATKLPEDQDEQKEEVNEDEECGGVGVYVIINGKVLTGTRMTEDGYGLIGCAGGHIEEGETPAEAAVRELREEFGILPMELIPFGYGPEEVETGIKPRLFMCLDYIGDIECEDGEMSNPTFRTMEEIEALGPSLFQPFRDGMNLLCEALKNQENKKPEAVEQPESEDSEEQVQHDYILESGDTDVEFMRKNIKTLLPIYKRGGMNAVIAEYRKLRQDSVFFSGELNSGKRKKLLTRVLPSGRINANGDGGPGSGPAIGNQNAYKGGTEKR